MAPKVASKYIREYNGGNSETGTSSQLTRTPSDTSQRSSHQLMRIPSTASQHLSTQLTRRPSVTSQSSSNQLTRRPSTASQRSSNQLMRMPSTTSQSLPGLVRRKSSNLEITSISLACYTQANSASNTATSPRKPIEASVSPVISELEQTTQQVADHVLSPLQEEIKAPSLIDTAPVCAIDAQSKQAVDEKRVAAPSELPQVSDLLQSTRQCLRDILATKGLALEQTEAWVKDDLELVKIAMEQNSKAFHLASERLKTTQAGRELIRLALDKREIKLQNTPSWVQDDEELVNVALSVHGLSLKYASSRLKGEPSIIQVALGKEACAIMFVEEETLNRHPHLAFEAIRKKPEAYIFLSRFLKKEDLRIQAMQASGLALKYVHNQYQTPAIVIAALENNPEAKAFIKEELKNDPGVVACLSRLAA